MLYNLLAWIFGSASPLKVECPLVFFCFTLSAAAVDLCLTFFPVGVLVCFPGSDTNGTLSALCGPTGSV